MPMQIDRKPGRKPLRRNGEEPGPMKAAVAPEPTLRVRMLKTVTPGGGTFEAGKAYHVPVVMARSWIGFGLAEEDKSLDRAPETK